MFVYYVTKYKLQVLQPDTYSTMFTPAMAFFP